MEVEHLWIAVLILEYSSWVEFGQVLGCTLQVASSLSTHNIIGKA